MAKTFFFYDLETSGLNARDDRIMQFAGQRTDQDFSPIGEPINIMIKLSDDTLPSPGALMVTGITPQKTVYEGYSELEFCKIFYEQIATSDTTIVGFNNVRFDDEFIRAILWRSYFDPYQWSYSEGRSRWDMLDVIRMTRALRPDGIKWPVVDGKATNRLELLTKENNISHDNAHDALSDVKALIAITKLIAEQQPRLFNYLLSIRNKNEIKKLVSFENPQSFVYTSGRYSQQYQKTTIAYPLAPAEHGNVLVYDLHHDPEPWLRLSAEEIKKIVETPYAERGDDYVGLPVKKLQYNRCPAVAPIRVLDSDDGWKRLDLSKEIINQRIAKLKTSSDFIKRVSDLLNAKAKYSNNIEPEASLYDDFVTPKDNLRMEAIRNATANELKKITANFADKRLASMLPRYKAYNAPSAMTDVEREQYDKFRRQRIARQEPAFIKDMSYFLKKNDLSDHQQFVLEELQLWYQSIVPSVDDMSD